jgi:hypothetical protein
MNEEEKDLEMAQKLSAKFPSPPSTEKLTSPGLLKPEKPKKPSKRGHYGYRCKCHGLFFQHIWELGVHVHQYYVQQRRAEGIQVLLRKKPGTIPDNSKIIQVERHKGYSRIRSTFFMPNDVNVVRVYGPIADKKGFWVYFEPLG